MSSGWTRRLAPLRCHPERGRDVIPSVARDREAENDVIPSIARDLNAGHAIAPNGHETPASGDESTPIRGETAAVHGESPPMHHDEPRQLHESGLSAGDLPGHAAEMSGNPHHHETLPDYAEPRHCDPGGHSDDQAASAGHLGAPRGERAADLADHLAQVRHRTRSLDDFRGRGRDAPPLFGDPPASARDAERLDEGVGSNSGGMEPRPGHRKEKPEERGRGRSGGCRGGRTASGRDKPTAASGRWGATNPW